MSMETLKRDGKRKLWRHSIKHSFENYFESDERIFVSLFKVGHWQVLCRIRINIIVIHLNIYQYLIFVAEYEDCKATVQTIRF